MSDPAATLLPTNQQLDSWKEEPLETVDEGEGSSRPEVPEAALETFFDQSTIVSNQAEEYWTEHVLKRPFEADEEEFRFNEHTHTERGTLIEELSDEQAKLELELGSLEGEEQKRQRQRIVALREHRVQIIMEQAAADIAYLLAHRASIESEVKELAVHAQSQADIESLKKLGEKALHLSSRMDKFALYSEAAINLFKKYRETASDLSENVGDQRPHRDQEFMYQMLIAVEKSTGNDYEISGVGDRDYITTFTDIRDTITGVNHKDLALLIATRVSQLEKTTADNPAPGEEAAKNEDKGPSSLEQAQPSDAQGTSQGGVGEIVAGAATLADFARDNQAAIAEQDQQLRDTNQDGVDDSRQGTNGMNTTELPEHGSELKTQSDEDNNGTTAADSMPTEAQQAEKEEQAAAHTKAFQDKIQAVFTPKK